ncbi:MAG: ATP-binding protein [Pseudomonadota bacterium]
MVRRRLYTQLCLLFAISLVVFAGLATALWEATGLGQYEHELFRKTSSLLLMLLPPPDAGSEQHTEAIRRIGDNLDIDISVWSDEGLLAARGAAAPPPDTPVPPERWVETEDQTKRGEKRMWMARLPDGRTVIIALNRIPALDNVFGFASSLLLLAALITLVSYPFIRSLTKRLERLQMQVLKIASGDLTARVEIDGHDEVASLANSFNHSAEQLESLVAAQRLLLANASHELRTPLARIRLGIEMLQTGDKVEQRQSLQEDIRELDDLIDELLLLTRLDTQTELGECEPVDLLALAAEECARYPTCGPSGTNAEVFGDRRMLQHLMRNLVDNAFIHGKPPVAVVVSQIGDATLLAITDAGAGIPEEERDRVIQPFYRAPDRQSVPGYGLGLSLVHRIASLHGARVEILNQPASEIRICFPGTRN